MSEAKASGSAEGLRIGVVAACPFPAPRGTPVRIQRLSDALARRGHEVHVWTYHLGEADAGGLLRIHRTPRVPTYTKVTPGPSVQKLLVMDPLLTWRIRSDLSRMPMDLIHAHHYEGLLTSYAATLGRSVPLVYDAHTLLGSELPFTRMGIPRSGSARVGRALDRWLPRLSDHVVSVSRTIKDRYVQDGLPESQISVAVNGVEHEIFAQCAGRYPDRDAAPLLVFTGNLSPYQRVDLLLEAFAKVVGRGVDARLLFVTQSSFDAYEKQAIGLGIRSRLAFSAAPFHEQPPLMADALIAVNPRTDCDGIPQKLLNYMAAGRATVSFEGSAPCVEHGKTGWIVPNGDVDAFASAIVDLVADPALAERLGRQARQAILAEYTWEIAAAKCERIYRQLLARKGRA